MNGESLPIRVSSVLESLLILVSRGGLEIDTVSLGSVVWPAGGISGPGPGGISDICSTFDEMS